ncbi:unnamed protein product [Parascedosporium putredinis]|uniref:SMP-30/Gluconolactonase/LRE-like region domain-containing protein n=1 Tax=Parascedosporium putredinis TaxID=1442378 RepID=A0A9P1MA17_9PEZI|nr:unnamed protein product [Parascedosporium putredinis]CAI7991886.1 unnamed protein product [Parascedosporium putredinis]
METTHITIVKDLTYAEGPRWHEGRLWFVDFYSYRVLSVAEDGSDLRLEAEVPQQPSGLGWLPDGRLLVVSMRNGKVLRREADGTLWVHADVSSYITGHLNDMVAANLLRIDPDGAITVVADDLWFPNGAVITETGTLLVNETIGNRITAFDIADGGELVNRRVWASFGDLPEEKATGERMARLSVMPDGCALDAEGALWVADVLGKRLLRVREGGEILEEIDVGSNVFACALGGADGRTLFGCAAPDFHEEARKNAREGSIVAVRVKVPRAGVS